MNSFDPEDNDGWQVAMYHENVNIFIVNSLSDRFECGQTTHTLLYKTQSPLLNDRDTIIIASTNRDHYHAVYREDKEQVNDVFRFPPNDSLVTRIRDRYSICCPDSGIEHEKCDCPDRDEFQDFDRVDISKCFKPEDLTNMTRTDLTRLAKLCNVPFPYDYCMKTETLMSMITYAREMYLKTRNELVEMLHIIPEAAMRIVCRFENITNVIVSTRISPEIVIDLVEGQYDSKQRFLDALDELKKMVSPSSEYEKNVKYLHENGYEKNSLLKAIYNTSGTEKFITKTLKSKHRKNPAFKKALTDVLLKSSFDLTTVFTKLERIRKDTGGIIVVDDDDDDMGDERKEETQSVTQSKRSQRLREMKASRVNIYGQPDDKTLALKTIFASCDEHKSADYVSFGKSFKMKEFCELQEGGWLNDSIVDVYITYLRSCTAGKKIYVGDIGTYVSLTEYGEKSETRVKSIFNKIGITDFSSLEAIYLPINIKNNHWVLLKVDPEIDQLIIFDSLRDRKELEKSETFNGKRKVQFDNVIKIMKLVGKKNTQWQVGINIVDDGKVPRQGNDDDCGVFMLMFIDYLLNQKQLDFSGIDAQNYRFNIASKIMDSDEKPFNDILYRPSGV